MNQCDGCRSGMPFNSFGLHVGPDGKPHMTCTKQLYKEKKMSKIDSIMIDLETLATSPNAAVIQVGAVAFDSHNGTVSPDAFERDVDLFSAVMLGGEVEARTAQWWRDRGGLELKNPRPLREVLTDLSAWLKQFKDVKRVWCQGANFDEPILSGYYKRAGIACPWPYYAARDTRTVYDLAEEFGWLKPKGETAHRALEDCLAQGKVLVAALKYLRGVKQ